MQNHASLLSKFPVVCALAGVSCALWGSAFPCVKIGYQMFSVNIDHVPSILLFAGMRFFLAGLLTLLIGSVIARRPLYPTNLRTCKHIVILSLLQTVLQYFLFYIGLAHTTGVRSSIIGAAGAFVSILVAAWIFHQEKLTHRKVIGCIIGFLGVILVNLNQGDLLGSIHFIGEGFVFLSTVSSSFSAVLIKQFTQHDNPVLLSGAQFTLGGLTLICIGLASGGHVAPVSPASFLMLFYLGCISAVAYTLWGILLKYNTVSRISVYKFMTPIFGVLLSAIFLHEASQVSLPLSTLALLLVCIGIFVVNRVPKAKSAALQP